MIRTLFKNGFVRNVGVVISGTAIAQIISVAVSPILTRQYGAESFGMMGIFISVVTVISTISALRYDLAIVLVKNSEEAKIIFLSALAICITISIAIVPLGYFNNEIMAFVGLEKIPEYFYLIPVAVFLLTYSSIYDSWLSRNKNFRMISKSTVLGTLSSSLIMLIGGWLGFGILALLLGSISNNFFKVIYVMYYSKKDKVYSFAREIKEFSKVKEVLKNYVDFPLYRAPQDLINALSQNAPSLILGLLFNAKLVGFFWLSNRVLRLPSTLISEAVRKVLYQKVSELSNNNQKITGLAIKATLGLSLIGFVPVIIMFLFGNQLFSLVFGPEWITAGQYSKWISVWVFFLFINVPAVVLIPVIGLQKLFLKYMLFMLPIRLAPIYLVGLYTGDDVLAVASFCVVNSITNLLLILYVFKVGKERDQNIILNQG